MGLIGVYENSSGSPDVDFEIEALHFNFWIVPQKLKTMCASPFRLSLPKFYRYYIDIGARITVRRGELNCLDMHLPCLSGGKVLFHDLEQVVLDETINDLLFGRPVDSRNNCLKYTRDGVEVNDSVHGIKSVEGINGKTERCTVKFKSPINATQEIQTAYFRFRYECVTEADIFIRKGWAFAKKGFLVDLRLNDVRETVAFSEINKSHHMKEVKEFNSFIVHPASFLRVMQSPSVHYSRLLEPRAWRVYLSSCEPYSESMKFVINQWKHSRVTYEKPFRMFVDLQKEFGATVMIAYFVGITTVPIINLITRLLS
jgi:hypothetical protein